MRIQQRKARWVPFSRPCGDTSLNKHITHNKVSARGLLGEGGVKEQKVSPEWGHERGRQTDREREHERDKREKRARETREVKEERRQEASCA